MTTATPTPAPQQSEMSEADRLAHEMASYVRPRPEPTPDLAPLPTEPRARRRAIAARKW